MTKKKTHEEYDPDLNDPEADEVEHEREREHVAKPEEDPNAVHEFTVLTDGAVFHKDHFKMKKADVPPPEEREGDHVTCNIGDVVSLTKAEAYAMRSSGIALAERPEPVERAQE